MDTEALLALLREERYVSGAELGRRLGVTRAAVSKAVAGLKREGYAIESVPRRGHRLLSEPDLLRKSAVLAALGDFPRTGELLVLPSVDSTNTRLNRPRFRSSPSRSRSRSILSRFPVK